MREIDSVLTDENLRAIGLIDWDQSIGREGSLRAAPERLARRREPRIIIAEQGDEGNTRIEDEPIARPSDSPQHSEGKRKGKAVAYKLHKSTRWKSVVVSLPAAGVVISEAPPSHIENPFEGIVDIPSLDYVSLQQDAELEGLQSALDLGEPIPSSMADITGWSVGLHMHTHNSWHYIISSNIFTSEEYQIRFSFYFTDMMSRRDSMLGSLRSARCLSSLYFESRRHEADRDRDHGYSNQERECYERQRNT